MTSSLQCYAENEKISKETRCLGGILLRPMCDNQFLPELPLVDFGTIGVIRCNSCRAYLNPYVKVRSSGANKVWQCNLCYATNTFKSQKYAKSISQSTPEFSNASIEIVAPEEYMARAPQAPCFLFVICANESAVSSGMLALVCETIGTLIDELPGMDPDNPGKGRTRVGILTYSSQVHFYQLNSETKQPKMFVMPSIDDPYLPIPSDELVAEIATHGDTIKELLQNLPGYHADTNDRGNCLGSALVSCYQIMEPFGGKAMVFNYGMPNLGAGKCQNRENKRENDVNKVHLSLKRDNDFYILKSVEFAKIQATVDLFAFSDGYCELPTIAAITHQNGGEVRLYHHYNDPRTRPQKEEKFISEVTRHVRRSQGWESVVRVRTSAGFKPCEHFGHFYMRQRNLVCAPCWNADSTIAIEIKNKDVKIDRKGFNHIFIQSALLYTTSSGQRRIRVHTARFPIVTNHLQLIQGINVDPYMNFIARKVIQKVYRDGLNHARIGLQDCLLMTLKEYSSRKGTLIRTPADLPESVQAWPDSILGALKCQGFRDQPATVPDIRIAQFYWLNNCPVDRSGIFFRPSLYAISELLYEPSFGLQEYDEDEQPLELLLPSELPLSQDSLSPDQIFLLDNAFELFMWVGKDSPQELLEDLFGISEIADVPRHPPLDLLYPDESTAEDSVINRFYNILDHLRQHSTQQTINVMIEGSANAKYFNLYLYEDRTQTVMSRAEFFQYISKATSGTKV